MNMMTENATLCSSDHQKSTICQKEKTHYYVSEQLKRGAWSFRYNVGKSIPRVDNLNVNWYGTDLIKTIIQEFHLLVFSWENDTLEGVELSEGQESDSNIRNP